jgi:hypothetical protein
MSLAYRILNRSRRPKVVSEIDRELASHIHMRIEDNLATGMPGRDARRGALVRFGNPVVIREQTFAAEAFLFEAFALLARSLRWWPLRHRRPVDLQAVERTGRPLVALLAVAPAAARLPARSTASMDPRAALRAE